MMAPADPKPSVVMLHGFLGSGADWAPIAAALAERYDVVCPDMPGPSREGLELDVPDRFACVGYSMGARFALWHALHQPEALSHLVLESVNPGIEDPHAREERLKHDVEMAQQLRALPDEAAMEEWLRGWYAMPLWDSLQARPELVEQLIARRRRGDREAYAWCLETLSIGLQENLWPRLHELTMPTLVIAGELDRKYAEIAQRMAECNPNIAVMIVSGAGHNVHLEAPETYTTVLKSFLSH